MTRWDGGTEVSTCWALEMLDHSAVNTSINAIRARKYLHHRLGYFIIIFAKFFTRHSSYSELDLTSSLSSYFYESVRGLKLDQTNLKSLTSQIYQGHLNFRAPFKRNAKFKQDFVKQRKTIQVKSCKSAV